MKPLDATETLYVARGALVNCPPRPFRVARVDDATNIGGNGWCKVRFYNSCLVPIVQINTRGMSFEVASTLITFSTKNSSTSSRMLSRQVRLHWNRRLIDFLYTHEFLIVFHHFPGFQQNPHLAHSVNAQAFTPPLQAGADIRSARTCAGCARQAPRKVLLPVRGLIVTRMTRFGLLLAQRWRKWGIFHCR